MEYKEVGEKSDMSCEGCCFEMVEYKARYEKRGKRSVQVGKKPTGRTGCVSPNGEPFVSCKERRVIFLPSKG